MRKNIEQNDYERELKELMEANINLLSLKDKTNVVLYWSESPYYSTPQYFLGEDQYINYLYYLLVNSVDSYIGNTNIFIPSQKYRRESTRLFMPDKTNLSYIFEPCGFTDMILWRALSKIDVGLKQADYYNPDHDYRKEYNREFRNRDSNPFNESYLKSLMSEPDYKNFLIYRKLRLIDEKLGNCSPFIPSQDYNQEYIRQTKIEHLMKGLEKNEAFFAFYEAVDAAVNAVEKFVDLKPSPEDEDWGEDDSR